MPERKYKNHSHTEVEAIGNAAKEEKNKKTVADKSEGKSTKEKHMERKEKWQRWIGSCVLMYENDECVVERGYRCSARNMTCPFHLTKAKRTESLIKWAERVNSLSSEMQKRIADKYYGGKMPWRICAHDDPIPYLRDNGNDTLSEGCAAVGSGNATG